MNDGVSHADHVLGEVLDEGEEAPLGVEPRVRAQLLVVRLEGLDHPRDAELVVSLGAIERPCGKSETVLVDLFACRFLRGDSHFVEKPNFGS